MGQSVALARDPDLLEVLSLLTKALEILDVIDAPAFLGAHVDRAICSVRDELSADARRPTAGVSD